MVKKRLILQLQQKEIAALEEIIQTYHNYVAKIVYSILSFYSTEIDIQAVINQVFFALGNTICPFSLSEKTTRLLFPFFARRASIHLNRRE